MSSSCVPIAVFPLLEGGTRNEYILEFVVTSESEKRTFLNLFNLTFILFKITVKIKYKIIHVNTSGMSKLWHMLLLTAILRLNSIIIKKKIVNIIITKLSMFFF